MDVAERRAWLLRMDPTPRNLRGVAVGDVESWPIRQNRKLIQRGDLTFYWQSGDPGGLRGWGTVVEKSEDGIDAQIRCWLEEPIPRAEVYAANAIRKDNQVRRFARGGSFSVRPHEVLALVKLFPPGVERPDVDDFRRRVPLTGFRDGEGLSADWLKDFLQSKGISTISPLASTVIVFGSELWELGQQSPLLSTTRLLSAAIIVTTDFLQPDVTTDDWLGVEALSEIATQDGDMSNALSMLTDRYHRRPRSSHSEITISTNVYTIIERAAALSAQLPGGNAANLTANGLVASLLTFDDAHVNEKLKTEGYSLSDLRRAAMEILAADDPKAADAWRSALRLDEEPATDMADALSVASVGNDNPWENELRDQLGGGREARAFASLAASAAFQPPLAVGVFGEWGAGKTFFLRQIYEQVERLRESATGDANDPFLKNIVQIRFNAWHYAETNLWASLVDNIFSELYRFIKEKQPDRDVQLFEKLATARELSLDAAEQLVERRRVQQQSADELAKAQRELVAAQASAIPKAFWTAVWGTFRGSLTTKEEAELKSALSTLGISAVQENAEALKGAIDATAELSTRSKIVSAGVWNELGSKVLWCAIAALCLLGIIVFPLFYDWFSPRLSNWLGGEVSHVISRGAFTVAGMLGTLGAILRYIVNQANQAVNRLQKFNVKITAAIQQQAQQPIANVKNAETELAKVQARVTEAQAALDGSNVRLAEATQDYIDGTGRGRLLRFVRDRVNDSAYTKHLTLIATIRRDFEELANVLTVSSSISADTVNARRAAHERRLKVLMDGCGSLLGEEEIRQLKEGLAQPDNSSELGVDRIVLYIDDLDRCPPEKVADILQAVHLLLTYPLFVVIVAVDARWVGRALESHFDKLLNPVDELALGSRRLATAYDYMEKIFQIPYWVRPMGPGASAAFIEDRLKIKKRFVRKFSGKSAEVVQGAGDQSSNRVPGEATDIVSTPQQSNGEMPVPHDAMIELPGTTIIQEGNTVRAEPLVLTVKEDAFLKLMAPYVADSPRRALRFLNGYRVAKASMPPAELRVLIENGGYRALISQLAVTTGAASLQKLWGQMVEEHLSESLHALAHAIAKADWNTYGDDGRRLKGIVRTLDEGKTSEETREFLDSVAPGMLRLVAAYEATARRFSFWGLQGLPEKAGPKH